MSLIKIVIVLVMSVSGFFYLKHRHEQALIDQQETPTDSDCCWEGDGCDSVRLDSIELKRDSLNK